MGLDRRARGAAAPDLLDLVADPDHLRAAAHEFPRAGDGPDAAAAALPHGAVGHEAGAGAQARARTVHGAEPAHDGKPHGRADLRVGGGALCGDHRRQGHPRARGGRHLGPDRGGPHGCHR